MTLAGDGVGDGSVSLIEKGAAVVDVAGYGQLWVRNTAPTELYFTTDAGDDIQITTGTATAGGGGDTAELVVESDASSSSGSPLAPAADTVVIMCVTASGARYVQLPAVATATADRRYYIKDKSGNAATNNITIKTDGSEEIDGSSSDLVISTNWASIQIVTDGTKWYVI